MPVAPFHVAPALLLDAALARGFSVGAFTVVQVAIDVESAWNLSTGAEQVHAGLHSLLGALVLAAALVVPCKIALGQAVSGTVEVTTPGPHGTKYEVHGTIKRPNGREADLVSVWILRAGEEYPRFVTAFPGEKK